MTKRGENMTPKSFPSVLMEKLTEREARSTAAMLKRIGYKRAIIDDCRKRSPIEIAQYFEPLDEEARNELVKRIAQAAGLQP
jgi:hypothetical protein